MCFHKKATFFIKLQYFYHNNIIMKFKIYQNINPNCKYRKGEKVYCQNY